VDNLTFINDYLLKSINTKTKLLDDKNLLNTISSVANLIVESYKRGNKVLLAGNGGSAADAQHIAAEFVSRFFFDRPGLPAISLTTDTSMITAIGNDYGYQNIFSRQLQAQSRKGDIFIGISTSGNSENVVNAVHTAKEEGLISIVLCGETGKLKDIADIAICVPSSVTPFIQESHICIGHMICAIVEKEMFPRG
jgi:D-sedoheptulose 7-phosphate isomerase